MIITIDGPSASGKGTIAHKVAEHFGFACLDTGLLYRAVGYLALERGIDLSDVNLLKDLATNISLDALDKSKLKTEEVGAAASRVAVYPEVRSALLTMQRDFAKEHSANTGAVLDGRDIGTVVCPDADFKIFLTADVGVRAERRHKELKNLNVESIYDEVLRDLEERDLRDQQRSAAPLVQAKGSFLLDTTHLGIEEATKIVIEYITKNISH